MASRMQMVADGIRQARHRAFMTQRDLAAEAHISQSTISKWERMARNPSIDELARVCMALGTTPNDLLGFQISTAQWLADLDTVCGPGAGALVYDALVQRITLEDLLEHLREVEMTAEDRDLLVRHGCDTDGWLS